MKKDMWIEKGKINKDDFRSRCKFSGDAVSFQQCIEAIIDRINEAEDAKETALRKLDEWNKDEEIEKMRQRLEEMREEYYRGFPISRDEEKKIKKWCEKHDREKHGLVTDNMRINAEGVGGGRYSYHFVPTSIGVSGVVRCGCGDEFEFRKIG